MTKQKGIKHELNKSGSRNMGCGAIHKLNKVGSHNIRCGETQTK